MKMKEFKQLKVGDTVHLKNVIKIKQMPQWDGEYFHDSTGSLWCRFLDKRDSVNGKGVVVARLNSYYPDVVTVEDDNFFYEIPRKCLKRRTTNEDE